MLASSLSIWYITTQNGKIVQWRKITAGFHYTKSVCACFMLSWVERGFFKIFLLKVSNSGKIFILRNIEFFIKTPMIVQQSEKERHKKLIFCKIINFHLHTYTRIHQTPSSYITKIIIQKRKRRENGRYAFYVNECCASPSHSHSLFKMHFMDEKKIYVTACSHIGNNAILISFVNLWEKWCDRKFKLKFIVSQSSFSSISHPFPSIEE